MKTKMWCLLNTISRKNNINRTLALLITPVLISCTSKGNEDRVSYLDLPEEITGKIEDEKAMHLIAPVITERGLAGNSTFDCLNKLVINSGSDDISYYVCVPKDFLTPTNKRMLKAGGYKDRIIEVSPQLASELKKRYGNYPRMAILVNDKGEVLERADILKSSDKQGLYDKIQSTTPKTTMSFSPNCIFPKENELDTTFVLKNNGETPLIIYELEASCTCSSVKVDKKFIEPKDSTFLHLRYHNTKKVDFISVINIYSNSINSPQQISIHSHQ